MHILFVFFGFVLDVLIDILIWLMYWCMPQEFILKALNFLKNVQIIKALLVWGKGGKLVSKIFIVNVVYIYFSSTWQSCFFKGHGPARWGEQGRVSPSRGRAKRWGGGREGLQMCEVTMILMHDFSEITVQNLSLHHLSLFKNHFLAAEQKLTQLCV